MNGAIKAGIPFAIINTIVLFIIWSLWITLGQLFSISSMAGIPGNNMDASDVARAHWQIPCILLALALCPVIILIINTLAGFVSTKINAINDENEARRNGFVTGTVMWLIVSIAGLAYFSHYIILVISEILAKGVSILFLFIIILPFMVKLLAFVQFSRTGSLIYLRMNSNSAASARNVMNEVKNVIATGILWVKGSIVVMIIIWSTILCYVLLMFIINLY